MLRLSMNQTHVDPIYFLTRGLKGLGPKSDLVRNVRANPRPWSDGWRRLCKHRRPRRALSDSGARTVPLGCRGGPSLVCETFAEGSGVTNGSGGLGETAGKDSLQVPRCVPGLPKPHFGPSGVYRSLCPSCPGEGGLTGHAGVCPEHEASRLPPGSPRAAPPKAHEPLADRDPGTSTSPVSRVLNRPRGWGRPDSCPHPPPGVPAV